MKSYLKSNHQPKYKRIIFIIWLVCLFVHVSLNVFAQNPVISFTKKGEKVEALISQETKAQLLECKNMLNYPKSVERFYKATSYRLSWVTKLNHNRQLAPAMLILDCISQYGLKRQDFHSNELVYNQIEVLAEQPDMLSDGQRAIFDVLMTDAMITFMNHLHYGKFNISLTPAKVDEGDIEEFNAVLKLAQLMESKDFYNEISSVQPISKAYADLQKYLHLVRGQYLEDSYEFPEKSVRTMTINMERLRWNANKPGPSLMINIPAQIARLYVADSVYIFRTIVGKASSPTPNLESSITHFTTAPERKIPYTIFVNELLPKAIKDENYLENNHFAIYDARGNYVAVSAKKLHYIKAHPKNYFARQSTGCDDAMGKLVFRFNNPALVLLHDTPQPKLFLSEKRALSHGSISVEKIERLASLILSADGSTAQIPIMRKALATDQKKDFVLKTPLPLCINYITCEMIDSQLVIYNDFYARDRALEMAMFGAPRLLASDLRISLKALNSVPSLQRAFIW
ncbi:L,D-transpeptidase family protein [Pedobacter sp. R20-19]|uniref:L,D-transpeptidase family protein n=1 Tax=Pedobacter sp. R20-19 TaxID=1270196 RepID=UPI00068FD822|nr:L,D-transpeptidase family protein [Pedobacter sp. R20-19]